MGRWPLLLHVLVALSLWNVVSGTEGGPKKPFHVCPAYPCVAQFTARGRQGIYSWNV